MTEPALLIVALPADPLSPMNRKPLLSMVAVPAVELPRMLVKPVLAIGRRSGRRWRRPAIRRRPP